MPKSMNRLDDTLLGTYEGAEVRAHREGSVVRVVEWRELDHLGWVRLSAISLTVEMLAVLATMTTKEAPRVRCEILAGDLCVRGGDECQRAGECLELEDPEPII